MFPTARTVASAARLTDYRERFRVMQFLYAKYLRQIRLFETIVFKFADEPRIIQTFGKSSLLTVSLVAHDAARCAN